MAMIQELPGYPGLRPLIREVIAKRRTFTVADLAEQVRDRVPDGALAEALAEALPTLVREILRDTRPEGGITKAPQTQYQRRGKLPTHVESPQVRMIREDAWRRQLNAIYSTPAGTMKRLGDFTTSELSALADEFHRHGVANLAKERQTRLLAEDMASTGCGRLSDLDDAILAQRLGGDAA